MKSRLISFTVTLKFGHDLPILVDMNPQEAMAFLSMPSVCDAVMTLSPNFAPVTDELPEMPKE